MVARERRSLRPDARQSSENATESDRLVADDGHRFLANEIFSPAVDVGEKEAGWNVQYAAQETGTGAGARAEFVEKAERAAGLEDAHGFMHAGPAVGNDSRNQVQQDDIESGLAASAREIELFGIHS